MITELNPKRIKLINTIGAIVLLAIIVVGIVLVVKKANKNNQPQYPYFVATTSNNVNVRSGPASSYPILLHYKAKGVPVKVIDRYQNWLQIQNFNGVVGWVYQNLTKTSNTALVVKKVNVFNKQNAIIGIINASNVVTLHSCNNNSCNITYKANNITIKGWVFKQGLWGIK